MSRLKINIPSYNWME